MKRRSSHSNSGDTMREKLIGLGETSIRKSYFPELQQRLAELERFKALLDQSNDAIFLVQFTSMHIANINEAACRLLGYPRSILLSMSFYNIADISKSRFANEINRAKEPVHTENQETLTTCLYKCDGNEIPAEITVRLAVLDEEVYLVAVARDITERKLVEEELSRQREQLEEKVIERTIQLSETNAALSKEIGVRRQAETGLQEANQKLAAWVSELEERTAEMSQLIEMGEQLQSCQSIEEACTISAQYVQKLFPASQGALYLINTSRDLAEAVNMWGDSASAEKMFMPLNCWAIRRGRPHLVDRSHPGLLCGHITGPQAGQYLCVPLMANSETMGVLYLNHTVPEQEQQKSTDRLSSEHKTQLILALGEHIALAIVNLRLREKLRQQAIRDTLTGLFNRRYMEESLARELHRAQREKKPVGAIMFDIDHFKDFNDLFGHAGGDALLRELGTFLIKSTRGGDIVSRYGGEEFVYVLPGAALEETRLRAEELRQGVKELQVYHLGKPLGKITISVGVAAFPEYGLTSDEILQSVDTTLYRAKNKGRDQVVVASTIG